MLLSITAMEINLHFSYQYGDSFPQLTVLTSPTVENSYGLREISTTNQERFVAGYERTGHILTLPYATQDFVSNKFATTDGKINPNPFVVVQYVGDAALEPGQHRLGVGVVTGTNYGDLL